VYSGTDYTFPVLLYRCAIASCSPQDRNMNWLVSRTCIDLTDISEELTASIIRVSSSETSIVICQITWRNIPEDSHLHTSRRKNLKSQHWRFCLQVLDLWIILLRWENGNWNFVSWHAGTVPYTPNASRHWGSRHHVPTDGTPPHYHCRSTSLLDATFTNKWAGRGGSFGWPPRSPDLIPRDLHFWSYVKDKVYVPLP
jgi:hypothetical protein